MDRKRRRSIRLNAYTTIPLVPLPNVVASPKCSHAPYLRASLSRHGARALEGPHHRMVCFARHHATIGRAAGVPGGARRDHAFAPLADCVRHRAARHREVHDHERGREKAYRSKRRRAASIPLRSATAALRQRSKPYWRRRSSRARRTEIPSVGADEDLVNASLSISTSTASRTMRCSSQRVLARCRRHRCSNEIQRRVAAGRETSFTNQKNFAF